MEDITTTVGTGANAPVMDGTDYTLDPITGQRTHAARSHGEHLGYDYNDRGEVTGFSRTDAAGVVKPASGWGFAYDDIGNRKATTERSISSSSALQTFYEPNAVNQYVKRTVPVPARRTVRGTAHPEV